MGRGKEEGNGRGEGRLSLEAKPCSPKQLMILKY